ncbi:MAG: hypothetical protein CV089_13770 [Nitrospira sp. WS110]|nr:hypothetical protein [Nitrospira sp. WS110]
MKSVQLRWARSTTLCAGAIMILALLSLDIERSYATHDSTLSEPLLTQGKLPPEEADGPFQYWSRRKKYFLVIAVNQTDGPKTELPFAQVDGQRVVNALSGLGYKPLLPDHPLLTGKEATSSTIMAALDEARKKEEEATLVIYYTGHGAVGPKDLWLQTAGQKKVGDGQGVNVSNLIVQVRQTAAGKGFEGELVLILDACYSGQGTVSQGLTLGDLGKHTTIFTSSTNIQESFSLNDPNLPEMSAFTHTFLQALGPDWGQADGDHDGLLRWEELKLYTIKQLRQLKEQGALGQSMKPELLSNYSEGLLSYQRDQVRIWRSGYRDVLTTQAMERILADHLQKLEASPKEKPALPKEAQLLAKNLEPDAEDYYARAVKATAEGQLENARSLFAKAEAQSQERVTKAAEVGQRESERQGQIYLARARMEMYGGRFTEAFDQYQQAATISPSTTPELLNELGVAGLQAGKYAEALPYLTEALKQREQTLPLSHPDVAISFHNLALLYYNQGQYLKAEPLYQRALGIGEKALGPDHPNVALNLNGLALLYYSQGQYAKAEPLYQRALDIEEKALGPDHPNVALTLNNLAELYRTQGEYAKVEPLYQRALGIGEKALGPDHPNVALNLNNLALLYYSQGQYAKAEPLYQRALGIGEKALGPDHPNVALTLNNLAELYRTQGEYAKAEPLYQRALDIEEKALGPDHPNVARDLNNLAELYRAQGQYDKAVPLYQRALAIWEQALGIDHPNVATSLNNLALLYYDQGQYAKAEPLYQRALDIEEKALGPDHPNVALTLNNLAALYYDQEQYAKAEPLLQRALGIGEKTLGPDHPNVALNLNNLAELYRAQGQYDKAEPLYQRSFRIALQSLGPEHTTVRQVFVNYQKLLKATGQHDSEQDAWVKLRSAEYTPPSKPSSP